tara:strand:+ start:397 stop:825 length:429 start_codon:yes stop_codon:yes gene_type:complete
MKLKFGIVLIIFTIFFLPNKTLSQNVNFELKNIVPEELRILKEEYSSIIIGVYMERCVQHLYQSFLRIGLHPAFARKSSFQVCGCSIDTLRSDMSEKDYLDMMYNNTPMSQALMSSALKTCGEMYAEFYSEEQKKNQEDINT